jgi:glutathione S-transferase
MLKLYYAAPSRAIRPRWLLEEMAAPYELARLNLEAGEQKQAEYLAINPNGTVPTLVDGDLKLFESAAICQYLADRFPEAGMAPAVGTMERGHYYQWMHYSMTAIDIPFISILHHTAALPEAERIPAIAEENRKHLSAAITVVEQALADRPYLLGENLGAADVMVGSTLVWAASMHMVPKQCQNIMDYATRLGSRPAFLRASAD